MLKDSKKNWLHKPEMLVQISSQKKSRLGLWEGWVGGYPETWNDPKMFDPPLPKDSIWVKVGVRVIFSFMGGVGGLPETWIDPKC